MTAQFIKIADLKTQLTPAKRGVVTLRRNVAASINTDAKRGAKIYAKVHESVLASSVLKFKGHTTVR